MDNHRQFGFFLVRYMPDALKGEFVNIGVVLLGTGEDAYADSRFTRDWRRARCLDPDVDVEMLQALESEVRAQLSNTRDRDLLIKRLQDTFSNAIQISEPQACLGQEPQQELEKMAQMYLESSRAAGKRELSGRQHILSVMRSAFEQAGVWSLLRQNIHASKYTHAGDPLKIDCGYRPNGIFKMFQAVSLANNADAAKILAFSYPQIAAGMAREEKAQTALTAIVEDNPNPDDEAIGFALATMKNADIRIAVTAEMPSLAERARLDLRV